MQQPRHPGSDKRIATPLLLRQSRLVSQRLTNAIYAPSGRQRPLPLAKSPEAARVSKRGPLRGTRRIEPAGRLPPAAFPSQRRKSKPAPLSTRQRKPPARPPATHPFHLFGPLVARVLCQKCAIRRIARRASRRTRRKERRRQRLAHGTRKLWDSKVSVVEMVPTSFRSGRVPTNVGSNDLDDVECHGLCTRQALIQQFRADVLPSFRSDAISELGWIVLSSDRLAPTLPGSQHPPTMFEISSEKPSKILPPSPNYAFYLLQNINDIRSRLIQGTLHVPTTWEVRIDSL